MPTYKCYDITLEDGSSLKDEYAVSVDEVDMSDIFDRQDHLVSISGALESVVGKEVESYSYTRVYD